MVQSIVELRNVPGTEAAMGWAGSHTLVVDRPEGRAGGSGLGFNGGQLLALAIGGCYCNDLRYVAHDLGVEIGEIAVTVTLDLEGTPLVATNAVLTVSCTTVDGSDPKTLIDRAWSVCTVANSLNRGVSTMLKAVCSTQRTALGPSIAAGARSERTTGGRSAFARQGVGPILDHPARRALDVGQDAAATDGFPDGDGLIEAERHGRLK